MKELDTQSSASFDFGCLYIAGAWLTGIVTFIGCWIYCIATYGFLFGVGLGWLPSAICAVIAAVLWPLIALAVAMLAYFIFAK